MVTTTDAVFVCVFATSSTFQNMLSLGVLNFFFIFFQNPIFWQQLSNFEVLQKKILEFSHASINISYLKLLINACDPFRL